MTREEFIKIFGECPEKMILKGKHFSDPEILRLRIDTSDGLTSALGPLSTTTLAFLQAIRRDTLSSLDEFEHEDIFLTEQYEFSNDKSKLKYPQRTVAEIVQYNGRTFTNPNILNALMAREQATKINNDSSNWTNEDDI